MKKSEIETHSDRGPSYPAINVKVYKYPSVDSVVDKFKCSEETAQKALDFACESSRSMFWEDVESWAQEIIGKEVKVYSQGRSGGWLVVHNLPEIESWDAVMLAKWNKFNNRVKNEIKYRCELSYVLEEIEANQWYKDGSEKYNYINDKQGNSKCISDLKAEAIKQGFGGIIRK